MDPLKLILDTGFCCITCKPLKDCKKVNWVEFNMKASWRIPIWNITKRGTTNKDGVTNMAIAIVHDECVDAKGVVHGEIRNVIELNENRLIYHQAIMEKPEWKISKYGLDTSNFSPINLQRLEQLRKDCLRRFKQSYGRNFKVKGSSVVDVVAGIDPVSLMIMGRQHGEFHIDACQLLNSMEALISK